MNVAPSSISPIVQSSDGLTFTLLAVGAGQCAVLETPGGRAVLIDAGSSSLTDPLRKCIGPFLRTRGRTQVDTLILTHSDYDHINAAASVASIYDVREVLTSSGFHRHAIQTPPAEALLKSLDALDLPPRTLAPGDHVPLGRGVEIEMLWPGEDPSLSSNDSSCVFRINYAGKSILITGDIQDIAESGLMKRYPTALRADVLIAPHHGSSESSTAAFIRAIDPRVILSSNDRTLSSKQHRFDQMIGNRPLFRTHECGAITVRIAPNGTLSIDPFLINAPKKTLVLH